MSYKKTKASLKSRLSSGDFVQQDFSAAQQGIMAGANIIAQGMKDKYKERREEEKRKAAAAAKRAAASRKAEKEAQQKLRIATSIATRFGIEPTNTEGMTYVMNEVEIHGTGAIDVIQKDYEDGKLQTPTVEITEDYVTGASPNQAPPMRLSPNPDGSPRTTLSLGKDIDDLEATDPSAAAAARSAAESAFSPQQLYGGEVQTATTTSQGFKFDPTAKKIDIDWMGVDENSVKNIRRLHNAGQQVLSGKELAVLEIYESDFATAKAAALTQENLEAVRDLAGKDEPYLQDVVNAKPGAFPAVVVATAQSMLTNKIDIRTADEQEDALNATISSINSFASMDAPERQNVIDGLQALASKSPKAQLALDAISAMTAAPSVDTKYFYIGVSTVESLEAKIMLAERSLTGQAKTAVLEDLNQLLTDRKAEKTNLGLTEMVFYGSINVGGTPTQAELVLTDSGDYYSTAQQKIYKKSEVSELISQDNQEGLVSDATKIQTAVFTPMLEQRAGIQTLLRQAKTIDDLVKQSDGKVLTFIGGRLPSLINRIMNEYKSFEAFVAGADKDALAQLVAQEMPTNAELAELGISANEFARFNSQAVEFAFTYARTGMGQQRTTDQDFQAAFKVVTAGSDYATYTQSLRELTQKGIQRAVDEHDKFLTHPTLRAAMLRPGATDAYGDMAVSLMDVLGSKGSDVEAQIAWANGEGMDAPVGTVGGSEMIPLGQQISTFKNLDTFSKFQSAYNNPKITTAMRNQLVSEIARTNGISIAAVNQALGGTE